MKSGRLLLRMALWVVFPALLVSCPANVPPPMKVIEPLDTSNIHWQVEQKIAQAGFIRDPAVSPMGEIVSTRKHRYEIFPGDQVFIRQDADGECRIGRRYITYRLFNPPVIDDRYPVKGFHHYLTGVVEVVDDWKGLFDGRVIDSYRGISAGDLLMPMDDIDPSIPIHQPPPGLTGRILGSEERTLTFATNDLVLLDRGLHHGIQQGQIFGVYNREDANRRDLYIKDDLYLKVGSLIVLRTEADTATALIIDSERDLLPGNFFMSTFEEIAQAGPVN